MNTTNKFEIPLNRPYFNQAEDDAVRGVLDSGMVSQGEVVEEFEEAVRKYVGAKYAVAVSSCTAGLYLALKHKTKQWGITWRTSAFTFPAVHCVRDELDYDGSPTIENIDVEKETYNMDIPLEPGKQKTVDVVIPIHQFGLPCNMDFVRGWAYKENVVEDAACALGSEYSGEKIGKRGTAVFSFHGRKVITTGEGGMVVTDDEEMYDAVMQGRQYGKDREGRFVGQGINFKMSNIAAAIGLAQMEKLDWIVNERWRVARKYDELLRRGTINNWQWNNYYTLPYFALQYRGARKNRTNWQSYVIRLREKKGIPTRDEVMAKMRARGIEVQVGSYDNSEGRCPVSAELARTTLALPIWPGMTTELVESVVEELGRCLG